MVLMRRRLRRRGQPGGLELSRTPPEISHFYRPRPVTLFLFVTYTIIIGLSLCPREQWVADAVITPRVACVLPKETVHLLQYGPFLRWPCTTSKLTRYCPSRWRRASSSSELQHITGHTACVLTHD